MKGAVSWSHHPYRPPLFETGEPYICRVAPNVKRIFFAWLPLDGVSDYTVGWRVRGEGEFTEQSVSEPQVELTGLSDQTEYEFYVRAGAKKSRVRLARTGFVPGDVVVNYLHPEDEAYSFSGNCLCSPSIVRHPQGFLLASMDVFRGGGPQDLTLIFRSDDDGDTWHYVSELFPCFWARLFIHNDALYVLSASTEYGDLLIGRSDDGGVTFAPPTVLLRGSYGFKEKGVHKNPQKILSHDGRLWTTLEWGSWATGTHAAMCASVPQDADLLDPANWSFTEPVPYDPNWKGTAKGKSPGCIEGCMVESPTGELYNMMRYQIEDCEPNHGLAILMRVDPKQPEQALTFDRVVQFPGNHSKFEIHYDSITECYLSFVCYVDGAHPLRRNLLSLVASKDLDHWVKVKDIFDYTHMPEGKVGFQYVSYLIEGEDLLFLCRTAFNKATNYHDSNYSVFSRLKDFRPLVKAAFQE